AHVVRPGGAMQDSEMPSAQAVAAPRSETSVGDTPDEVIGGLKRYAERLDAAQRREVELLLGEFAAWEATRAPLAALGRPQLTAEQATRTVAFFDGVPGAGKTTHIERLIAEVGADYLSMARFAEARDVSQAERRTQQLGTGTLHPTDLE